MIKSEKRSIIAAVSGLLFASDNRRAVNRKMRQINQVKLGLPNKSKSFRHKKAQKAQKKSSSFQAFVRSVRFVANFSFVVLQARIKPDSAAIIGQEIASTLPRTTLKKNSAQKALRGKCMTRWFKGFGQLVIRFGLLSLAGWATLAIMYSNLPGSSRMWIAGTFGVGSLVALVGRYSDRRTRLWFLAAFAVVLGWWLLMPPSNSRNWQPDVAVLPRADIQGNRVTIHNIRNCDYRSETDYTVRHYDKTFDLAKLKNVDLFLVYWGSPYIAHTMLSFGFEGDGNVCISIETRKEMGETYSNFKGFFRQYELIYVVADERDLIGLRTNYRGEQVYLYRINASADLIRKVFLDYLREVNSLNERPEWYNAFTGNCTTGIRGHIVPYNPARLDWRIIVNGFIDRMLYERKMVDTSLPFPELKKRSLINERAKGLDKSTDFSRMIRVGLPGKGLTP